MSEEIVSPPWPTDSVRVDTLFEKMKELHAWAAVLREAVNRDSDHQAIPPLRAVPRKSVHDALPVPYHYANFVGVRRVRELWDSLVRDHEDSWDARAAFVRRRNLVAAAVEFLNNAWLSQEAREAKMVAAQEQFLKDSLAKSFGFPIGLSPPDGSGE